MQLVGLFAVARVFPKQSDSDERAHVYVYVWSVIDELAPLMGNDTWALALQRNPYHDKPTLCFTAHEASQGGSLLWHALPLQRLLPLHEL